MPDITTTQTRTMTAPAARRTTTTWDLDPAHSSAQLAVRHMMIATVRGHLPVARGTVEWNEDAPEQSRIVAELDASGINTNSADRDQHLRSGDFLDVEKFPTLRFESTRIEPQGDDRYRIEGDLTIRGVTRKAVLDAVKEGEGKDPWGKHRGAVTATTTIDRTEWGLTWNAALETGGVLVAEKVKVTLNVQAVLRE